MGLIPTPQEVQNSNIGVTQSTTQPAGNAVIPTVPQVPATVQSTPAPQIPSPTTPTSQPSTQTQTPSQNYTVQSGDTLSKIAQQSGLSLVDLINQNPQYAQNPNLIKPGQMVDISKKYQAAFDANKSSATPQSSAEASSALDSYFNQNPQSATADPQKSFFDQYLSLNPVVKNLYDTITNTLSSIGTQQTFQQQYQDLITEQGIPGLQTDLMNINNIMDGSEQDIRDEVTKVGGFATESQVQALTAARNKTLLKQANVLTQQLQTKEDYVNKVMQFSQADRAEVDKQVDQKLNLTTQLSNLQDKITQATKDNYNNIVQTQGYGGLYAALQNNPQQLSQVETMLGLGQGGLKQLASYTKPLTAQENLQNQNLTLQNKKLQQDITTGPTTNKLQFVPATANQPAGTFNPTTGVFTPIASNVAGGGPLQMASAKNNIDNITTLVTTPNLAKAVGTTATDRLANVGDIQSGVRSNFLAGTQQLTNQLTLDALQNAKANGATFGALSEGELALLSASATKLNTWAIKDRNGNVIGYNTTPAAFKTELDKINNFAKLDYIVKGGDPVDVGVTEMNDGTFWTKNSDGSFTQIR